MHDDKYPTAHASGLISVHDYARVAADRMEAGPHGYYAGGACDEITLVDQVAAWSRRAITPRMLVGVEQRDPSVTVLGRRRPHPLIIAPMAFQVLATPEGEAATARAASDTDTVMCLSTLATTSP